MKAYFARELHKWQEYICKANHCQRVYVAADVDAAVQFLDAVYPGLRIAAWMGAGTGLEADWLEGSG